MAKRKRTLAGIVLALLSAAPAAAQGLRPPGGKGLKAPPVSVAIEDPKIVTPAPNAVFEVPFTTLPGTGATEFVVVTVEGGAGETVVTVDAGAFTDRFSVSARRNEPARVGAAADLKLAKRPTVRRAPGSAPAEDSAAARTRAPRHADTVIFRHFADDEPHPEEIPVTITATDSRGKRASIRVRFKATLPLRFTQITPKALVRGVPAGLHSHTTTELDLGLTGTALAELTEVRATDVNGFGCVVFHPKVDYGFTPVVNGAWRGKVQVAVDHVGPCRLRVEFEGKRPGGLTRFGVNAEAIPVIGFERTTVERTWGPLGGRDFRLDAAPGSVCQGTSSALGGADHRVGKQEIDGDLAFVIRSGPAGTRCTWTTRPGPPPHLIGRTDGVRLAAIEVEVDGTAQCTVKDGAVAPGFNLGRLDFMRGITVDDDAGSQTVSGGGKEGLGDLAVDGITDVWGPGKSGGQFFVEDPPLTFTLDCNATATNDHFVRVRVKRAIWRHPAGVRAP